MSLLAARRAAVPGLRESGPRLEDFAGLIDDLAALASWPQRR
jgi:hypothetical protein